MKSRAVPAPTAVRIWDLPTRVFHWVLAACVVGSVVSAKLGGDAMAWHFRFGYTIFALLAFRLLWGVLGGRWSRFASFVFGPATLWRHLRGRDGGRAGERLDVGHSPSGALSVFAMLGLLAVQVGTGLVADDEILNVGPLNLFVSADCALSASAWHSGWGQWLILALVALHLAAVGLYTFKGRPLVDAMLHGDKHLPAGTPVSDDGPPRRLLALALLAACAAAVALVVSLGG